uniref:EB domain-containing protein n=1 Tax=Caenorhabditis tropicalis TaxID=1561998 RepID=A0A1I7U4E1_9PELO
MLKLATLAALLAQLTWAQHGTVGRPCEVSTDCGTGNYCAGNKRCACLTTYVEIDSYCWRSEFFLKSKKVRSIDLPLKNSDEVRKCAPMRIAS